MLGASLATVTIKMTMPAAMKMRELIKARWDDLEKEERESNITSERRADINRELFQLEGLTRSFGIEVR